MRSRDRLPSQQEILDGSTPSAELSGPRDIAERAASETAERNGNDGHSTNANFPVSRYTRAPPSVIIRGKRRSTVRSTLNRPYHSSLSASSSPADFFISRSIRTVSVICTRKPTIVKPANTFTAPSKLSPARLTVARPPSRRADLRSRGAVGQDTVAEKFKTGAAVHFAGV